MQSISVQLHVLFIYCHHIMTVYIGSDMLPFPNKLTQAISHGNTNFTLAQFFKHHFNDLYYFIK